MAIEISPYDPTWPQRFADESARIGRALGSIALSIEHVGSTAVVGLAAKDIIDIQVAVASFVPEAAYRAPLEQLGYQFRPDDEPEHRFFRLTTSAGRPIVHVHVCAHGGAWERDHLVFRDRLRADPEKAAAYRDLKLALAPRFDDADEYADAKGAFIRQALD